MKPNTRCQVCGKEFYARPSAVEKGYGKYCSLKCRPPSRKKEYPKKFTCVGCGDKFEIYSYRERKRKFCSKSCATKVNNTKRKGTTYKKQTTFKNMLLDEYGKQCMICGYSIAVDGHHLVPKSQGGSDVFENGILVCPNCHKEIHLGLHSLDKLKNIIENHGRHPAG